MATKKIAKQTRAPAKAASGGKTDDASRSLAAADFGKFKPKRRVPGVVGRSEWFTGRLGYRSDGGSVDRITAALKQTSDAALAEAQRSTAIVEAAFAAVAAGARKSTKKDASQASAWVIAGGRGSTCTLRRARDRRSEFGAITELAEVDGLDREGLLVVTIDRTAAEAHELDHVMAAQRLEGGEWRLVEGFKYIAELGVVAGRIDAPGAYQVFAFPKNPWIKSAVEVLAAHWKWVEAEAALLPKRSRAAKRIRLIDRVCTMILCAPELRDSERLDVFAAKGVAFPPGGLGGLAGGAAGNVCDACLGDFFGGLGGTFRMPPLLKWWWLGPPCSRWESIGPVPAAGFGGVGRISQIATHPTDPNVVIAGAAGGGVWRSDDSGATWRPLMELEPTLTIGAVAIAPSDPEILYAASGEDGGGYDPAWGGVGLYRSTNGGVSWTLMANVPSTRFSAIVVHPSQPDTVYVAGNRGLHKSRDGGATWVRNGSLGSLFDGQITDVVIAHDDPDRIYLGVRNDGVYRSTTGGEPQGTTPAFTRLDGANQLPTGAALGWPKLAIGRTGADGSRFLVVKLGAQGGRILRTLDAGATWTELAANVAAVDYDEWCSVIAVDPSDPQVIYAGAAASLARTTNGGAASADWGSIYSGIHADQQDIAFDPTNPQRFFLANDGGVYVTTDRGTTFTMASGRLAITQFYDIDIAERDPDIVAGGAQDNGIYYRDAVGRWTHIPWGDGTQVAVDATDPRIFYFSAQEGLPTWLRRSVDAGASHQQLGQAGLSGSSPWVTILKLDPTDPIQDPANNRIVLVCGFDQVFRSTNGGQAWQRVNDAGGNAFTTIGTITALEFAPSDPSILYLGTSSGALYRAVNGGAAAGDWTRIDTAGSSGDALFPNAQIQSLAINPADPSDVWVVFGGAGVSYLSRPGMILNPLGISHVFRTRDAGANWRDVSGRVAALHLPDVPTSAIAISDVDRDVAYAGTDVGVFRTIDGGTSWRAFQDGLPRSPVVELKYHRRRDRLFAATMGRGVYIRDV